MKSTAFLTLVPSLAEISEMFKAPRITTAHQNITSRSAKRNRQVVHVHKTLPVTHHERRFTGRSAYKSYKPLHAIRRVTGK